MEIKVKNCNDCPFMVSDYDDGCVGCDTVIRCQLAYHLKQTDNIILIYDSYDDVELICDYCESLRNEDVYDRTKYKCQEINDNVERIEITPSWCPLIKNENIIIHNRQNKNSKK